MDKLKTYDEWKEQREREIAESRALTKGWKGNGKWGYRPWTT